jgi:hypothetical protein
VHCQPPATDSSAPAARKTSCDNGNGAHPAQEKLQKSSLSIALTFQGVNIAEAEGGKEIPARPSFQRILKMGDLLDMAGDVTPRGEFTNLHSLRLFAQPNTYAYQYVAAFGADLSAYWKLAMLDVPGGNVKPG